MDHYMAKRIVRNCQRTIDECQDLIELISETLGKTSWSLDEANKLNHRISQSTDTVEEFVKSLEEGGL